MDEGGVDAAVIHPPGWDAGSTDMAFDGGAELSGPVRDHGVAAARSAGLARPASRIGETSRECLVCATHSCTIPRGSGCTMARSTGCGPQPRQAGVPIATLATDSLTELGRIAERHPGLRLTIDHLGGRGGLTTLKDAAAMTHMPDLLALAKFPNVAVKATGAPGYSSEAYPFPAMQIYLRQIYDAFGPHRMFWGTDITKMPCSWRAMRDDVHRGTAVAE